jgi:hypothetical protein
VPPGPGTASPCRIGTGATALADIDRHVPGINRPRVAGAYMMAARPVRTEHRLPGPQHRHGLASHQDVLPRHGHCGESTDPWDDDGVWFVS